MLFRSMVPWFGAVCAALIFSGCETAAVPDAGTPGGGGSGGSTSPVPVYVLIGGATNPGAADVYLDSLLEPGQVFIVPKSPLLTNSTYTVTYTITAGGTTFTAPNWTFDTVGASANPADPGGSIFDVIDLRRGQTFVPTLQNSPSILAVAARRHAGYQCEDQDKRSLANGAAITHGEQFSGYSFFVNDNFGTRIQAANSGAVPHGATNMYETIATNGGSAAVVFLWNTVYHRLPMMRHDVTHFGAGSRAEAETDSIYTGTPMGAAKPFTAGNTATNAKYLTIDWTRVSSALTGAKFWPANGQGGVNVSFDTNTEVPDPIGTANEGGYAPWNNGTPEAGVVGVPLQVSLPTTGNITAIEVTLTKN